MSPNTASTPFFIRTFFACSLAALLSACGTAEKSASIELTSPSDGKVIVASDDVDEAELGLQYDVEAVSSGVSAGSVVLLNIEGEDGSLQAVVGESGQISFDAVKLPPGTHKIYVSTATGDVRSDEAQTYSFKALAIISPQDGAKLTFGADDSDPATDGQQVNVSVQTFAIDPSEAIDLMLDGVPTGDKASPGAGGIAVFKNVSIANGEHTLQAAVGKVSSPKITVHVMESCASLDFVAPAVPENGEALVLGGGDACSSGRDAFTTTVEVSTDAADGSIVELKVNGMVVTQGRVKDSIARFEDVVLSNRGATANTLSVIVQGVNDATCKEQAYPVDILVDCAGPSCSLASPKPVLGLDKDGKAARYLNESLLNAKNGFDFKVKTDKQAIDGKVELLVDEDARTVDAKKSGSEITAAFATVKLADGAHAIQARCTDAAGNSTLSSTEKVIVDVTPCGLDITAPSVSSVVLPDDDVDAIVDGVQVHLTAAISGSDCVAKRAAECVIADGITGVAFATYDGASPLTSNVTLSATADPTLCLEVRDRAGNVAFDSVALAYRTTAPALVIESPIDADSFNAEGDADHIGDSVVGTPECNATFSVACTEIGQDVELHRDLASNAPFVAAAPCAAPGVADPDLPSGYVGRATFDNIVFLASGSDTATIVATQTLTGIEGGTLQGESAAITVTGDCEAPVVELSPDPCGGGQLNYPGSNITKNVSANLTGSDITLASVSTSNGATTDSDSQNNPSSPVTFNGLSFGGLGTVTVGVTAVDAYGNSGSDDCTADIVNDLPILMVSAPLDETTLDIGDGCNPGVAGSFGVTISGTADKTTTRSAAVSVDGGAAQALTLTGAAISGCVAIPTDGAHVLDVSLTSTSSTATVHSLIDVTLDTLQITAPASMAVIGVADACNTGMGSEFGVTVTATTDLVHVGKNATVKLGANRTFATTVLAGGLISACAPASDGANTIVVNVLSASSAVVATESRSITANTSDMPILMVAAPLEADAFDIGDGCNPGVAGAFGVSITGAADKATNRSATISVDGGASQALTLTGAAISGCVAIPADGAHSLVVTLANTMTLETTQLTRNISVDTLDITGPASMASLTIADACSTGMPSEFGVSVTAMTDLVHVGKNASVKLGANRTITGTVLAGGMIAACAPASNGSNSIVVSVLDAGAAVVASETRSISVNTSDLPGLLVSAPAAAATLGIGGGCNSGMAGVYGISISGTADKATNRASSVTLDGGTAQSLNVTGAAISGCVPVTTDGAHSLVVTLTSTMTAETTQVTRNVTVDTLSITSPASLASLTLDDACNTGMPSEFGVSVTASTDLVHVGKNVSVKLGANRTISTTVLAGGNIAACAPASNGSNSIVVSVLDAGAAVIATESRSITVNTSDLPVLTVSAPAAAATLGVGGGCNSGMAGVYGITITGTADKASNRTASVTLDGGASQALSVAGTSISGCIPVATEGAHTLVLTLTSTKTLEATQVTRNVIVDTLDITTPTTLPPLDLADACNTGMVSEYGVNVIASMDQIHVGRAVTVKIGSNRTINATVSGGGTINVCAPAIEGNNTLVVNVLDASMAVVATESRKVIVITAAPSTGIPITTVTVPPINSATYRSTAVALAWATPTQDFPGQLVSYELRCANTALNVAIGTSMQHDAWWTAAEVMQATTNVTPPATSADVMFRIGDKRNCVLRGVDAADQLTPLVNSKAVDYPFRSKVFQPMNPGQRMGDDIAPIGDVNDDGINDLLVGGRGEAYLIFGSKTGWTPSTPDVVFVGTPATRLGSVIAGLGDFNDDGMNDFAISASLTTSGALTAVGRVFVFFGRAKVGGLSDWPSSVDLSGSSCAADVCFNHDFGDSAFGIGMSNAGDFNGDAVPDLAVGAPSYPGVMGPTPLLGRLYILLGQKFEAGMTKLMGQKFWNITVAVPSASRGLYLEGDNVDVNALGNSLAAIGSFDGTDGDDLIVAAPSSSAPAVATGKVFYLSGHPYDFSMDAGMKQLSLSELGLRDMSGTPNGLPIDSGTKGLFGGAVYSLGNVIDLAPGTTGMRDIAIKVAGSHEFLIYPGDNDFNAADKIRAQGDQTGKNPGTGNSVGTGFSPALQSLEIGDLDDDGFADVCAGENVSSSTGAAPGAAYLWYGSIVSAKTSSGVLSYKEADSVAPAAVAGAGARIVELASDLNDDGAPDMAIGDPVATSSKGALTILY